MKFPDVLGEVLDPVEVEGAKVALEHDGANQAQVVEQLRFVRESLAAVPANRMDRLSSDGFWGRQVPAGFSRYQVREESLWRFAAEASEPWTNGIWLTRALGSIKVV